MSNYNTNIINVTAVKFLDERHNPTMGLMIDQLHRHVLNTRELAESIGDAILREIVLQALFLLEDFYEQQVLAANCAPQVPVLDGKEIFKQK